MDGQELLENSVTDVEEPVTFEIMLDEGTILVRVEDYMTAWAVFEPSKARELADGLNLAADLVEGME